MNAHNEKQWPEANFTLGAGENKNTLDLRTMIARYPATPDYTFYCSRWEMEEAERRAHAHKILNVLADAGYHQGVITSDEAIKLIADNMPLVYLMQAHTPVPVMVTTNDPTDPNYPFVEQFMQRDDELAKRMTDANNLPGEN